MPGNRSIIALLITLLSLITAQAQHLDELLAEFNDSDSGINEFFEFLSTHPVNINELQKEDLERFPFLSESQMDSILAHLPLASGNELKKIIGDRTAGMLLPFVRFKPPVKQWQLNIRQRNYYTLQPIKGIENGRYCNSPVDNLTRITGFYDRYRFGVLLQKDVGEANWTDHVSGYISWNDPSGRLHLIGGNYLLNWAEGLMLSAPFVLDKSSSSTAGLGRVYKTGREYLSSFESSGINGLYIEYGFGPQAKVFLAYGNTRRDAGLSSDRSAVTGLSIDGYHRTENEIAGQDVITEQCATGGMIFKPLRYFETGFAALKVEYNPAILFTAETAGISSFRRNRFRFS